MFNAEYPPVTTAQFCASDDALDFNGARFPVSLNGGRASLPLKSADTSERSP